MTAPASNGLTLARVVVKGVLPFVALFALYTLFHGDLGAGGGFQAGTVLAAGVLLHLLVFGRSATERALPERVLVRVAGLGVLIYGGTGLVALAAGRPFLDYGVFDPHDPSHGQHWGILLVETGVTMTVAASFVAILVAFVRRARPPGTDGEAW